MKIYEWIAFIISISAFLYGLFKIYRMKAPLYFKLIVNAIGCYALEELWVIVNVMCNFENDVFSVRLIGILGCFCSFIAANVNGLNKIVKLDNKWIKNISYLAPVIIVLLLLVYTVTSINNTSIIHIVISIMVVIPLIIDSYYELRNLMLPKDEIVITSCVKQISGLILLEYIITLSYFFIESISIKIVLDIISAIVMLVISLSCEKGAKNGEY